MQAVRDQRIKHVCTIGRFETRASGTPGLWNVVALDLVSVNLLGPSTPCFRETFVTTRGGRLRVRVNAASC